MPFMQRRPDNNNNTSKYDNLTDNNRTKKYRYGLPAKLGHLAASLNSSLSNESA